MSSRGRSLGWRTDQVIRSDLALASGLLKKRTQLVEFCQGGPREVRRGCTNREETHHNLHCRGQTEIRRDGRSCVHCQPTRTTTTCPNVQKWLVPACARPARRRKYATQTGRSPSPKDHTDASGGPGACRSVPGRSTVGASLRELRAVRVNHILRQAILMSLTGLFQ